MRRLSRSPEERFWSRVAKGGPDECWRWSGATTTYGYGQFSVRRRIVNAHRFSVELATGKPIPPGQCVLHQCDNPPCVNPAHLTLGTKAENSQDMVAKRRNQRGEARWNARLTEVDVMAIRARRANGETYRAIGVDYGITAPVVFNVVKKQWRHVGAEGGGR